MTARIRSRLAISSTLALATALVVGGVPEARAQSFDAAGTVVAGSASIGTGSGTTDVFVSGNAVINWSPNDTGGGTAPIIFQPSGTTATFSGATEFTVLNRILPATPTRAVQFDGTVLGRVGAAAPLPGGTVYFYSPGGIIASPTAVFDVGNLGLTSSPVVYDPATGVFDAGDTVSFQTANAGSSVVTQNGSQITASGYVAIVAPTVNQSGAVNLTAGSASGAAAALVAADAADITFSPDGLFNITVTQGTSATGTVLQKSGSITGPAGSGLTASHRVYMVAIPQNQAITMTVANVSGLGFDIAAAADVDGNAVVLSGGYNVAGGEAVVAPGGPAGKVDINIVNTTVTSRLSMTASGRAAINAVTAGPLQLNSSFASDVDVASVDASSLFARDGATIAIAGNANITAIDPQVFAADGQNVTAGGAAVVVQNGGSITVSGNLQVVASGTGGDAVGAASAGTGAGGTAQLVSDGTGSLVDVAGNVSISAVGFGGQALQPAVAGGGARGGNASLLANANGGIQIGGTLVMDGSALAAGGQGCTVCISDGGRALGGAVNFNVQNGGTLSATGGLLASAIAQGGTGQSAPGGDGLGGGIDFNIDVGTVNLGPLSLSAYGLGGSHATGGTGGLGQGGTIDIRTSTGSLTATTLDASAYGAGGDSPITGGIGGNGTGGSITSAIGNGSVGDVFLNAGGFGASGDDTAGKGTGGTAQFQVLGTFAVTNTLQAYAHGSGGSASGGAAIGGDAQGGFAEVTVNGGALTVSSDITADASAFGGSGFSGGDALGGTATFQSISGGAAQLANPDANVVVAADAIAGDPVGAGSTAGNSTGGTARLVATGNGSIDLNAFSVKVRATALASLDPFPGSDGGNGTGGTAFISQGTGGSVAITAPVLVDTHGEGGQNSGAGDFVAGAGTGGDSRITVNDAGGISITGPVQVIADGYGGDGLAFSSSSSGGVGTGGIANIGATNGSNDIVGAIEVRARGFGGDASGNGSGGAAQGGQALVGTVAGATPGHIGFGDTANISVIDGGAIAGNGSGTGAGGAATGQTAQLFANGGNVDVTGQVDIVASGSGGGALDGVGGKGTGGAAGAQADGSQLTLGGDINVFAEGAGGNTTGLGSGGDAQGGTAFALAINSGAIRFQGNVAVDAVALGGNSSSVSGNGGNAIGGTATVRARTLGTVDVIGNLTIDASGVGGDGDLNNGTGLGGRGQGGVAAITIGFYDNTGTLLADGGGASISLSANTRILGRGTGGDAGQAGDGLGGQAAIRGSNGSITAPNPSIVSFDAGGLGGTGNAGGSGGNATGGIVTLVADNHPNGAMTINLRNVDLAATGEGGFGNRGLNPGDTGGKGGNGQGGQIIATGSAGNGNLTTGSLLASAYGSGGGGGDGGASSTGAGGVGGAGGNGDGGLINVGVQSGAATVATNAGSAQFGQVRIFSYGVGGFGGAGGTGITQGIGGNGGNATGGSGVLLVRGAPVTIAGSTTIDANATGGDGGAGSVAGNGGNALSGGLGGVGIIVTNRFNQPAQRGTLTAGTITGTAIAAGGTGAVNGQSSMGDSPINITLTNSDATVAQLSLTATANAINTGAAPSGIAVTGGTFVSTGPFDFNTSGDLTLSIDSGALTGSQVAISARNWLPTAAPAVMGTLTGTSGLTLLSQQDLIAGANLSSTNGISLLAATGRIQVGGLSSGGNLLAQSQGPIAVGAVSAAGNVDLISGGGIATGNASAGGYLNIEALGSVTTGGLVAGEYVEVDSLGGPASIGNVTAGDHFTLQANGDATVGDISAGIVNPSLNPLATYNVGVAALGNTTVGNVSAAGDIGLLASGGSVTAGSLGGRDMLLLADSGVAIAGDMNAAGRIGIAKSSLAALGGTFDTFDKEPVFSALPFAITETSAATLGIAGPITLNGAVNALSLRAYTTSDFSVSGAFTAASTGFVSIAADGDISALSNITTGGIVAIAAGKLSTAAISSGGLTGLFGLQETTLGNVTAGGNLLIVGNTVSTGNLTSDPALFGLPATSPSTVRVFGGTINTGQVVSGNDITFAGGQLTTGPLQSRTDTLLLSGGAVTVNGPIVSQGRLAIANSSQAAAGGQFGSYDSNLAINSLPGGIDQATAAAAGTGGAVSINGSVNTTGSVKILAAAPIAVSGGITTGTPATSVVQLAATGNISVGGAISGSGVLFSSGNLGTFGGITSRSGLFGNATNGLTVGNVAAADRVLLGSSAGNVTAGNVVSDPAAVGAPGSLGNTLSIGAGGSISTGNLRALQAITLVAPQNITTGQINGRQDVAVLAGQSVTTGTILAGIVVDPATGAISSANGRVLIGAPSMLQGAGPLSNINYSALFNAASAPVGGNVQINGGVVAFYLRSYSQGAMSAGAIQTFNDITVESGGLVTVRQRWTSPDISIQSADIDIQQAQASPTQPNPLSGLNAGTTGQISLVSTSTAPALIGDGLTGTGYALSQAEWSRINSGSLTVVAIDQAANPVDMFIGNLAMTGPLAGSTIDDPNGSVVFGTGTLGAAGPVQSGGIRVDGNLAGTGFTATNSLEFYTGTFELNASTGSVRLTGTNGALSGTVLIDASHIHIADPALLTKLSVDPFYTGRIADLNRPAPILRTEGVLSALGLDFYPGSTLYIQNTGTALVPAGFLVSPDVDITPPSNLPAGGIQVVVNGAFVTPTGTLSGRAAYDGLIAAQPDFTGFSSLSQLNSCLFVGGCQSEGVVAPPADDLVAIATVPLSDDPAVSDDEEDEEKTAEEIAVEAAIDGAPIVPPAPLIDTRPLSPPVTITEPITGSGNPALIGSAAPQANGKGETK